MIKAEDLKGIEEELEEADFKPRKPSFNQEDVNLDDLDMEDLEGLEDELALGNDLDVEDAPEK